MVRVNDLVAFGDKEIDPSTIPFTRKTRTWCRMPYEDHDHGCPNYGKNELCPGNAPYRDGIIGQYKVFMLVWVTFNFRAYKDRMKVDHPGWTERQLGNVLYWQSSVKKLLKEYIIKKFSGKYDDILGCGSGFMGKQSMESAGIYAFGLMRKNGIPFEVKPVNKVVLVSLLLAKGRGQSLLDFL